MRKLHEVVGNFFDLAAYLLAGSQTQFDRLTGAALQNAEDVSLGCKSIFVCAERLEQTRATITTIKSEKRFIIDSF